MKMRLDELLLQKGIFSSRSKAQAFIRAGRVKIGDQCADKPGKEYPTDRTITLKKDPYEYVSRGAYKIKPVLDRFKPALKGKIAVDIGASTGGFSQVLLEYGAKKVYAIDVGRGQLDWSLRQNNRIQNIEGYNARYFKRKDCIDEGDTIFVTTVDVSFISLSLILPPLVKELPECQWYFVLIKPQFEASRKDSPHGVVKDRRLREKVVEEIKTMASSLQLNPLQTVPSPLKGPKGNQEYMMVCRK